MLTEQRTILGQINDIGNKPVLTNLPSTIPTTQTKPRSTPAPLVNQSITSLQRAKMVDWMLEVIYSMRNSTQTFFQAVKIMDKFFIKQENIPTKKLHRIGSVSLYMASKIHDVKCISLRDLYEKICWEKISKKKIVLVEQQMATTLNFRMNFVTPYNVIQESLEKFNYPEFVPRTAKIFAIMAMLHPQL